MIKLMCNKLISANLGEKSYILKQFILYFHIELISSEADEIYLGVK